MDEFKLSVDEKNLLCAVIQAESGFKPTAKNINTNGSSDYGICQINDKWWIGPNLYFKTPYEVMNFPEKSVRFMCEQYKKGKLTLWSAYNNQSYKKYL
jgi:hypothetical protein